MTRLSVVVISLNEGESLRRTVDNLRDTLPSESEIIVVDDSSTDGSSGFLDDGYTGCDAAASRRRGWAWRGRAISGRRMPRETFWSSATLMCWRHRVGLARFWKSWHDPRWAP